MGVKEQAQSVAEQGSGHEPSALESASTPCALPSPESVWGLGHPVISWWGTFLGGEAVLL